MRRGIIGCLVGLLLALPLRVQSQATQAAYRYVMTGTRTASMPGQPAGPQEMHVQAVVSGGLLRMDYLKGGEPTLRPGSYLLLDSRTGQMVLVDSVARQSVSLSEGMSASLAGMAAMMTLSDTATKLEDLGPGETIAGYATRKYRLTIRYTMGVPDMAESKTSMVQVMTMQVSDAVGALDPGFALATAMTLNPNGPPKSPIEEQVMGLMRGMPKGFALSIEQDMRVTNAMMEAAMATSMRVTDLTKVTIAPAVVAMPDGLTKTDFMAYMLQVMQRP